LLKFIADEDDILLGHSEQLDEFRDAVRFIDAGLGHVDRS